MCSLFAVAPGLADEREFWRKNLLWCSPQHAMRLRLCLSQVGLPFVRITGTVSLIYSNLRMRALSVNRFSLLFLVLTDGRVGRDALRRASSPARAGEQPSTPHAS